MKFTRTQNAWMEHQCTEYTLAIGRLQLHLGIAKYVIVFSWYWETRLYR